MFKKFVPQLGVGASATLVAGGPEALPSVKLKVLQVVLAQLRALVSSTK